MAPFAIVEELICKRCEVVVPTFGWTPRLSVKDVRKFHARRNHCNLTIQPNNEPASPAIDISNQFINDIDVMVTMTMTALTSAMQMRKGHKRPRVVLLLYM